MRWRVFCLVSGFILFSAAVWADNFVPVSNNEDVKGLGSAARSSREATRLCDRAACPEFSCKDEAALTNSLNDSYEALSVMEKSLHSAFLDYATKLRQLQQEESERETRNDILKLNLILSKAFLDAGKIYLDLASFADLAFKVNEVMENPDLLNASGGAGQFLSVGRWTDQMLEAANGMVAAADDVHGAILDYRNATEKQEPWINETVKGYADLKAKLSGAAGAALDFRDKWRIWKQVREHGTKGASLAAAGASLRASWKGLAQVAGQFLGDKARAEQEQLLDELEENARNQKALDANFLEVYRDIRSIGDRQLAVQSALAEVERARTAAARCDAQCDEPRNSLLPPVAGQSYGTFLKAYNAVIPQLTARITSASQKLSVKGLDPRISVSPSTAAGGDVVKAEYALANCKHNDGAIVVLVDQDANVTKLGNAGAASPAPIAFKAPAAEGEYRVILRDRFGTALASAPLSVADKELAEGCGASIPKSWLATGPGPGGPPHLVAKSYEYVTGTKGKAGYGRVRVTVSPSVRCDTSGIGVGLFAGASRTNEFFKTAVVEGDPSSAIKYPEQLGREWRVFFDNGTKAESSDFVMPQATPAGAKRVTRVEVDFDAGDQPQTTLIWR